MIKKWNAVCSWMLTLFLLGHMLTMSIPMLTGGQDYSDCQILAGGIVATVLIHVVLCIVSYYPRRGILNFHRYRKSNWRLITQRISGIVILILLYPHMRVLHLIISGASFSGVESVGGTSYLCTPYSAFYCCSSKNRKKTSQQILGSIHKPRRYFP